MQDTKSAWMAFLTNIMAKNGNHKHTLSEKGELMSCMQIEMAITCNFLKLLKSK